MKVDKLEFYVLNYNRNKKKVEMYNIFQNANIAKRVEEECRRYFNPNEEYHRNTGDKEAAKLTGFEAIMSEIDSILQWQLWARREYEISVADAFEDDVKNLEKWDCYAQAHANIYLITRMCLEYYVVHSDVDEDGNKILYE